MQNIVTVGVPFGLTTTLNNGQVTLIPTYFLGPNLAFSAYADAALLSEAPLHNSISTAIVGSSALTFVQVGQPFGGVGLGGANVSAYGYCMLWQ